MKIPRIISDRFGVIAFWVINVVVVGYYGWAAVAPASPIKAALLPGVTTHGHYQIELQCAACHGSLDDGESFSNENVLEDSCVRCHGEQLDEMDDTHPAKKFNDPANAELLAVIDAQKCVTCHREHVPDQTLAMGVTVAADYCWHCHQDIGDSRESHVGMAFDSCATAGCHNFHDNRALYDKYLDDHFGEPDFYEDAKLPLRNFAASFAADHPDLKPLGRESADAPDDVIAELSSEVMEDWATTAHAAAGVNCSSCHTGPQSLVDQSAVWSDAVSMSNCESCHAVQTESFVLGRHAMRLGVGLSPMTPAMARLPMVGQSASSPSSSSMDVSVHAHAGQMHKELTCNACHAGHRFDTNFAATTACLGCHADEHSLAYQSTSHARLWESQLSGESAAGTGVSCATCHLPRLVGGDAVSVSHNQSEFLRPSDTMARTVCSNCHGLEFSLSALADPEVARGCFGESPQQRTESVEMAHEYFETRRARRRK